MHYTIADPRRPDGEPMVAAKAIEFVTLTFALPLGLRLGDGLGHRGTARDLPVGGRFEKVLCAFAADANLLPRRSGATPAQG